MIYKPSDYQSYATRYVLDHPHAGVFLEMGLGKTVITLTALQALLETGEVSRAIVIAPLNVARTVWAQECAKWDHLQGIRVSRVLGSAKERKAALQADADLYVINRENVEWLMGELIREHQPWPYDMIIIDELSSFKNHRAKRFRALSRVRSLTPRIVGLTGTPSPNGLIDLWAQIFILDGGERLGKSIGRYRDQFFRPGATNGHIVFDYRPKPGAQEQIEKRISDICVSMRAQDWISLPETIRRDVPVDIPDGVRKTYQQFRRDLVLSLPEGEISAANAAVMANKLLQFTGGAMYGDTGDVIPVHDGKLKALAELVDVATSPVLVFYGYRHEADRIRQAVPEAVHLYNAEQVEAWNRGEIPVLIAHPASAGHGLNLQAGGHTIVWYTLPWSLELYQQACARLVRRGQDHSVIIHHLVVPGTIDERVSTVLQGKAGQQDSLLSAVKAMKEEVISCQ